MRDPLYDRPEVCSTYFFPQPGVPLPARAGAGPVALALPDGTPISAYAVRSLDGAPTLLYFHGNGETIADQLGHWPDWAREAGANIFFVDYPGYALSRGDPTFTSCRQAARAALDHLLDQGERVVLAGRSVGSIFALDAAAARPDRVAGLMLESGVADLWQRLELRGPWHAVGFDPARFEQEVKRDFDHQAKLSSLGCPILVLHTRQDSLIPCWHAEQLARWAGERLLRLVLFEEGDHNTIQLLNEAAYCAHLGALVAACR